MLKMVNIEIIILALSFYELLNQLKYISSNLKLFHNLRAVFIKHE